MIIGAIFRRISLLFGLLCVVDSARVARPAPKALTLSQAYFSEAAVLTPNNWAHGSPLADSRDDQTLPRAEDCAAACADQSGCSWFVWCDQTDGCKQGNQALEHHQCRLLGSDCSLSMLVEPGDLGAGDATSGFPLPPESPLQVPGWATRPAVGMKGSDFECAASVLPGACAFPLPLDAAAVCGLITQCRAVVVHLNGTDGCSSLLSVLKNSQPGPDNSFVGPSVYTIEKLNADPMTTTYLLADDAALILPTEEGGEAVAGEGTPAVQNSQLSVEQQEGTAADASGSTGSANGSAPNGTDWLGCIVARNALMQGAVVETRDGLASEEACCRACRALGRRCNGELRYQELTIAELGWPPAVIVKGSSVSFTGGSPLMVTGPELPGYTCYLGAGLFGTRGFICPNSLKPELGECVLRLPLVEQGPYCKAMQDCTAIVYMPAGVFGSVPDVGVFKPNISASSIIYNPSSVTYFRNMPATAPSSHSLSTGAIAGIASGVAAVGAVAAAAAAVLLHKRWRRRAAQQQPGAIPVDLSRQQSAEEQGIELNQQIEPATPDPQEPAALQMAATNTQLAAGNIQVAVEMSVPQPAGAELQQQAAIASSSSQQADHAPPTASLTTEAQPLILRSASGASAFGKVTASPFAALAQLAPQPQTTSTATPIMARRNSEGPVAAVRTSSGSNSQPLRTLSGSTVAGLVASHQPPVRRDSTASGTAPLLPQSSEDVESARGSSPLPELLQYRALQDSMLASSSHSASGSGSGGEMLEPEVAALTAKPPCDMPAELQKWVVDPREVELLPGPDGGPQRLGAGASGCVFKAMFRGETVAVKELDIAHGAEAQAAFVTEAMRMELLRHPNVVTFFGVMINEKLQKGLLLLEYCEGRDLHSVLQLHATTPKAEQRLFGWYMRGRRVAVEVAKALNYLHSKGLVHMDVKSNNVLLTGSGTAKLADMGLSRLKRGTFLSDFAPVGTFAWTAPEVLWGHKCDQSVHIYGLGVLLWEICTGERPVRGDLRLPLVPQECPQEVCDLVLQCMHPDPQQRPTAQQLMQQLSQLARGRPAASPAAASSAPTKQQAVRQGSFTAIAGTFFAPAETKEVAIAGSTSGAEASDRKGGEAASTSAFTSAAAASTSSEAVTSKEAP